MNKMSIVIALNAIMMNIFLEPINEEDKKFLTDVLDTKNNQTGIAESISQERMLQARKLYKDKTRNLERDETIAFINFILNNTQFLIHLVKEESDAIRAFEIINSRGLSLKYFDKIKSFFLFYHSKYLKDDKELRNNIEKSFNKIYQFFDNKKLILKLNTDERLLRHHYLSNPSLFNKWSYSIGVEDMLVRVKELAGKGKDTGENQTFIVDYLKDIKQYIEAVYQIEEKLKGNKNFRDFYCYLDPGDRMYPLSIRLQMKKMLDDTAIISLEKLEFFLKYRKNPKKDVFDVLSQVMGKDDDGTVLKSSVQVCKAVDRLRKNQPRASVGPEGIIHEAGWAQKFILYKLNKRENNQDITPEQYKDLQLEHIFPQTKIQKIRHYGFSSTTNYDKEIQYIGNITLLEKELNISANNKLPVDKIKDDYSHSDIEMTRKIDQFEKLEDIEERTKKIESFARKYLLEEEPLSQVHI